MTRAGNKLKVGGQNTWFVGTNSNSGLCGAPDELSTEVEINSWYGSLRHDGHAISRVWALPSDGDRGLAKLRDVVAPAAKRNNVRLIVTLDDHLNACGRGSGQKPDSFYAGGWRTDGYEAHLRRMLPVSRASQPSPCGSS